ncbi:MAG TPA: hypothetical protein VJW20_05695 [Candidatus Angelobacter sp.]|nr:hypothetical protein [Candidatus Angelobacter sp.]
MKTKLKPILTSLLLACGTAMAQTNDCASLTHQALDLSGFNLTIDYMTSALASDQFIQQLRGRQDSEQFFNAIQPVLKKEFSGEILRRELQNRVAALCNAEQMRQTVEKLQSPFIARMLALEAATNSAEGQAKLQRYINIAQTAPPTDDRMEALEKLDESAGVSDFVTDFQMAMFTGILTGAGAPKEILDQIPLRRREMKAQRQNYVELGMSVTYHGVTRPELLQYAGELSTPPLKGFYSLVRKTFVEIVGERSQAMGRDLKPIIAPPTS